MLEEVLAKNLRAQALDECLQKMLTAQSPAGEDLRQLVLLYGWRPVVEPAAELLPGWDPRPWARWIDASAPSLAAAWRAEERRSALPRYVEYLCAARPRVARCLNLLRRHKAAPGPMAEKVDRLQAGLPRLGEAVDVATEVEALVGAAKVGRIGDKAWPGPAVYGPIKTALEGLREELRRLGLERLEAPEQGLAAAAVTGQRFLRVTREVVRTHQRLKGMHGYVDFQDLLLSARDLLRERGDLRECLQNRYRHVLIDEFQDTDPVQLELVELLCGGGLTTGELFAVGDRKQSIYRFRGAEVLLFESLRQRIPHESRQELTVNFRSKPAILDFTNVLLERRLIGYEPLLAHNAQINPEPRGEFLWNPRPEKMNVTEARAVEAEWIAGRIAALVDPAAGPPRVVDREGNPGWLRRARPGDVVLLFRAMSNVHLYEAALRRRRLHYYLVGGRAFFAQQEIYDLLNLLRALENPQDSVSLAGTLRSPFCCVSDEGLFVLGRHNDGLWAGLLDEALEDRIPDHKRAPVVRARRHLRRWRGLKDRLPIARLLGEVFTDSGFDAATQFEPLGDRKLANLWKTLDIARTFDRSGLFGLAEFIGRLGGLVRSQPREEQAATQPENADVVRLMTIHQAKGLEFPIVVLPDFAAIRRDVSWPVAVWEANLGCVASPPSDGETSPFPEFGRKLLEAHTEVEEWHEGLRTLYVACTRARDYLVLSAALPEDLSADCPWMLTLAERFDLSTGRCFAPDVTPERRPQVFVHDRNCPPAASIRSDATDRRRRELPEGEDVGWRPFDVSSSGGARRGLEIERLRSGVPGVSENGQGEKKAGGSSAREKWAGLTREVLNSWDFRDPDGWEAILDRRASAADRAEAKNALARFAESPFRARLAAAETVLSDVDFLLDISRETGDRCLPAVEGTVDLLWKDREGGWQLLGFASGDVTFDSLGLAAASLRKQLGTPVREVVLLALATARPLAHAVGTNEVSGWVDAALARVSARYRPQRP